MALLGEDGKPTPASDEDPNLNAEGEPAKETLPRVEISYKPDGSLTITGPTDTRLIMRMLHEALDLVHANVAANVAIMKLGQMQAGVQKPGLRDVLAFSKVRP